MSPQEMINELAKYGIKAHPFFPRLGEPDPERMSVFASRMYVMSNVNFVVFFNSFMED